MGGEIGVNTAPGNGSDFFFSLPVKPPEFPAKSLVPVARKILPHTVSHILVVDDDSINRKLIQRMLEKLGDEVVLAASGAQALPAIKESAFDLILMDIQMPGMNGLETTRRIRDWESTQGVLHRTPIFALTANTGEKDRALCLEAGMDNFLCKPIRMADLEELVEKNIV